MYRPRNPCNVVKIENNNNKKQSILYQVLDCVCLHNNGVMLLTHTDSETFKPLTVMYFTSMSVFLSSSAIISLWNLFNWRRRRWKSDQGEKEDRPD